MLIANYKGGTYYFNQFWMEIYYDEGDGTLHKVRDFHKWENILAPHWRPFDGALTCESIRKMNAERFGIKKGRW